VPWWGWLIIAAGIPALLAIGAYGALCWLAYGIFRRM
jgi:heme exporter protein D